MLTNPGAGILATFGTPGQAIRCAQSLRSGAAAADRHPGCGIHTGEVTLGGDETAAAAVRIAQDVAALARPAEILVSRTVKDLLAGSGYDFADRASHLLPGAAESWQLYAVTTAGGR
jgi:class 3 adenylate cyclase